MRSIIWLVLICLIGLGAVVAIKIGARTPEGADVDKAKVGAATEQGTPDQSEELLGLRYHRAGDPDRMIALPWHDVHSDGPCNRRSIPRRRRTVAADRRRRVHR